ncbi:MAG: hypothetical protein ABWZ80_07620 [Beijerinckiaceae bacterium]
MTADTAQAEPTTSPEGGKQSREQSSIGFPYGDLDDAVEVASAIINCGGVPCEADQVAGAMKQVPTSGAFRTKIATARTFGLIETVQGKYQLTSLGFAITDSGRQKGAKVDAFLAVPLYRKVYDTFRSQQLPPRPMALERTFVTMGVAQKQANRARIAFDRSAQQAGFFEQGGRDRLIRPPGGSAIGGANGGGASTFGGGDAAAEDNDLPPAPEKLGGGGMSARLDYHPFVMGLLDTLPAAGTLWTIEGRAAWLEAAASTFKLIYKGDGKITVTSSNDAGSKNHGGSQ